MHVTWGRNAKDRTDQIWDSSKIVNGHMLIMGMSGSGKTHTLRRIVREMIETQEPGNPLRIHVFDKHGDIVIEGASTVMFSEQTEFGLNPLVINPDVNYGGVRKRIRSVINTINRTSHKLGGKQEAVLRNILQDLYEERGFDLKNPDTWSVPDEPEVEADVTASRLYLNVPYAEREEAKAAAGPRVLQWDGDERCWWIPPEKYVGEITHWQPRKATRRYPSMNDAVQFARRIYNEAFLGTGREAVIELEAYQRAARGYQAKLVATLKRGEKLEDASAIPEDLEKAGQKVIDAIARYVQAPVKTGCEMDNLMKYESADVLKSVVDRLENLNDIGIFKSKLPPFDPDCPVWRYHIRALESDEQQLFVLFRLEELFRAAIQRGETPYIRDVFIVDEANMFFDDAEDNILNVLALEARKFGIALICASQSPTHFSDDFISSVGTKVVLGIDQMFWDQSARKLRLEARALDWIKLTESLVVQMKVKQASRNDWIWVYTPPRPAQVA